MNAPGVTSIRGLRWWLWPLCLMLLCFGAQPTWAVTVTKTPVAAAGCTSSLSGGTKVWSNPTRAWASDSSYATARVNGTTSRYLQCLNYGFSIPVGAAINGITLTVARKSNSTAGGGSRDAFVRLVQNGAIGTTDRATATTYTTAIVSEAHGGSSDLWGSSWTPADINSTTFGAAFATKKPTAGTSQTVSVDVISLTVDYTPDTTPPTAVSILRASPNPASGSTVLWTVTFSESVSGVDAGDFALAASGLVGTSISSVSGSGTTWTVTANTGTGNGTLGLNLVDNDSIVDVAANKLGGTGTSGAANGSLTGQVYTIDKANPNALSLNRTSASPTNAASLAWLVTFSESVTGVDSSDFQLAKTGTVNATIASVTGSGASYTVTANAITGTGTLGLNLVDDDSIVDITSNKLGGAGAGNGSQTGQVYTLDRTAPTVLQITRDDPNPSTANEVSWTVTFSESVSGVTSGKFNLAASGLAGARITTLTGGGSVWIVSADPGYGSGSLGLNLVDDDAIVDAVGNPLGGTGAGNGNFTGEVYTVTTPALAGYSMDEVSWNGSAGEVVDQSGNFSGTAKNNGTTGGLTPALSGTSGSCRYGIFTSAASPVVTKGFIELTAGFPYLSTSFTIAGWVRTTSNATSNQWIFTHNTGGLGYALSLGTPGAGRLRFSSGGAATPNLDSPSGAPSLLANNTWYFVAAVADFSGDPNIVRTLYVFDASGNLLSGYPVSLSSTGWDDTESGLASIGGDGNSSFAGLLDEIQFYDKTLNQAALTALAQARHPCSALVPDHYELTLPSSSLTCLPSTLTLTACSNASSPCTSAFTGAVGATATLSSSAGNLGASSFTFDATGIVSTTLSHPAAANGTAVSVTLTGTSLAAGNGSQCCPNGSSCSASSSCSTTFNSAGFMFTSAADATTVATLPAQVAGTSSGSFTLRAVRTNTSTKACESALVGASTVNWAVQCNNPTSCSAGSLMSLTGSSTVAIASNPNSGVGNTTAVPMVFDANGNAPFSFNYADVGQVTLWASKSVNSAALAGASNAFVVKPGGFTVSAIQQTSAPGLSNPAAANAGGARFVKAGESFSATVTARTSGGATTPNFGHEIVPEGVLLASQLVQPSGGAAGSLDNASIAGSAFSSGVATVSNLAYSEVGIITLTPSVADGDYLGAGAVSGSASVNVGRFVPAKFALSGGTATHRSALACSPAASFSYLGENFRLGFTLTAQNLAGGTTANYTGSFAKLDPTVAANWNLAGLGGSTTFSTGSGRLSLGSSTGSWAAGVVSGATITANASRAASPDGPFAASFGIAPTDSDGVAMAAYDLATTSGGASDHTLVTALNLRFGRLRLSSAIGAADRVLSLPVLAQYWTGTAFDVNTLDSCTALPTTALSFGNLRRTLTTADTTASGPVTLAAGVGTLRLAAPGGGRSGTFDIALSLGAGATDASCLQPWTPGAGDVATAGANLAYLRGAWCGSTYDKDPSARASFGMQRTQDYLVYRRENF